MAILVTGGAGYIGSHTCVELLNTGRDIVILDNFSNSKPDVIGKIKKLTGRDFPVYATDLLYAPGVREVFAKQEIDAVIHFAGLKAVGESVQLPMAYYHNNITGALNLCKVMSETGCKKLVFSSSATVYGYNVNVPFREDYPLSATNPYGMTKLMIEQILRDIVVSDPEWSVALLRYFNPIGAHKSGLLGEDPDGIPGNLMPYITQVAMGALPKLSVYGSDYDTPDGTGVRDYLHVVDLATGHLSALNYIYGHSGAEAVNLGTGRGYSVLEVIRAFNEVNGVEIPYEIAERRPGDIAVCYADTSKAETLLGWRAKHGLDEMCADAWNFTRKTLMQGGK
jgi:UDP-glucose 4-epimerase